MTRPAFSGSPNEGRGDEEFDVANLLRLVGSCKPMEYSTSEPYREFVCGCHGVVAAKGHRTGLSAYEETDWPVYRITGIFGPHRHMAPKLVRLRGGVHVSGVKAWMFVGRYRVVVLARSLAAARKWIRSDYHYRTAELVYVGEGHPPSWDRHLWALASLESLGWERRSR